MHLDINKMKEIVQQLYLTAILREYGNEGGNQLRKILQGIHSVYDYVEPETITDSLVIFCSLQDDDDIPAHLADAQHFTYAEHLAQEYDAATRTGTAVIQILSNDEYRLWKNVIIDLNDLCSSAIVYVYRRRQDYFLIQGEEKPIVNPSRAHASVFAIPTFRELRDALENYKRRMIRTSQCQIFSQAWGGGESSDRLFFINRPEATMRKSLWQYLTSVLGAEVRPEQIVDESHPCDIKVTWMQTNRIALIEIKWLGKSIDNNGNITQNFSESRARDGARQLADYLDANRTQAPTHQTRGYLVIIDGRRWRLTHASTFVNSRNGFWYRDKEITFNPEYHNERSAWFKLA
jgi:hypothetical protein